MRDYLVRAEATTIALTATQLLALREARRNWVRRIWVSSCWAIAAKAAPTNPGIPTREK